MNGSSDASRLQFGDELGAVDGETIESQPDCEEVPGVDAVGQLRRKDDLFDVSKALLIESCDGAPALVKAVRLADLVQPMAEAMSVRLYL